MIRQEVDELVQLVRAVARAEIMPRFRRLGPADVQVKTGPLDLVTVADEAAETALTQALLARHPDALVVGEEAASKDRRCSPGSPTPRSASSSTRSTAPPTSPRACRCSESWSR